MYRFYSISTYTLWKMLLNYYCCIWLIKEGKLLGSEYNCKGGACLLVLHGTFWIFGLYMWPWKERHPKLTFPRKEEAASSQEACIFTTIWELTHKAWGELFSAEKEASALPLTLTPPRFWDSISYIPGWPQTCYVAEDDLNSWSSWTLGL